MVDVIAVGKASPSTNFYLEYEWVSHGPAADNYSNVIVRARCTNAGNTTSGYGGAGSQSWWDNVGHGAAHSASTGFLPTGYGTGAQRWRDSWPFTFAHDANGNATISFGMKLNYGSINTDHYSDSWAMPRIPLVPGAPSTPVASAITTTGLTLTWSNGSRGHGDTDQVLIRRWVGTTPVGAYVDTIVGSSGTTTNVTGLTRGQTYCWIAYNHNVDGYSSGSGSRVVTLLNTVPDKPATPTLTSSTSGGLAITATDPSYVGAGVTGRELQLSTSNTFTTILETKTAGGAQSFTGLTRFTQFFSRYRVQNAIGWGPWSDILSAQTLAELPSAPATYGAIDIAATTAYSSLPSVADNGGAPLSDIRWQIATTQDAGAAVVTLGRYGYPFFEARTLGTLYWYRLAVANTQGWGPYGAWVAFTTKNNVPSPPNSFAAVATGDTTGSASWTAPTALNGSTLTGYTIRVAPNRDFGSGVQVFTVASGVLVKALDGLQPGSQYFVQAWANTVSSPGSYSSIATFTTTGTAPGATPFWLRVAGIWKAGIVWIKVGGVWRKGTPWVKVAGVWRKL